MPDTDAPLRMEQLGDTLYLAVSSAHTFGSDAFLLARFAGEALRAKDMVADLGTGCGIIAFLLYKNRRPRAVWGVDIQPAAIRQFEASLRYSAERGEDFSDILRPLEADLTDLKGKLPFDTFDLVTCNPPYKAAGGGILSAESPHRLARHEIACTLDDVCAAAGKLLKTGGRLCICQRPERLADLICSMQAHQIEPKRIQAVAKDSSSAPWLILAEGKKGAKPSLRLLPTLVFDKETAAAITGYGPAGLRPPSIIEERNLKTI